jgi:hypothetical protein
VGLILFKPHFIQKFNSMLIFAEELMHLLVGFLYFAISVRALMVIDVAN